MNINKQVRLLLFSKTKVKKKNIYFLRQFRNDKRIILPSEKQRIIYLLKFYNQID